ncbi:hypothetical protein ABPG74_009605 [Tetrahymena malaccensis]
MNKIIPQEEINTKNVKYSHHSNFNKNSTERCRNQSSDLFLKSEHNNNYEHVQQIEARDIESPKSVIQYNELPNKNINQQENPPQSKKSHSNAPSKNYQQCRICLSSIQDEEAKHLGDLLSICDCKGSIQYVHFLCQKDLLEAKNGKTLQMIIAEAQRLKNDPTRQQSQQKKTQRYKGIKFHKCDLCGYNYEVEWQSSLKLRPFSHMKTKKKCYLYSFCILMASFLLLLFGLIYTSLQYQQIFTQYYLIEYLTFDFFDYLITILSSEIEVFIFTIYNILVDFNNYSKVTETIFSFLGYMLIIFAIVSNTILLLVVSFKLFLVRTYFINSIQKQRVK